MATTKFSIISQATVKLGSIAVQSFTDGTRAATLASQLYDQLLRSELSCYEWSFNTQTRQLGNLSTAPTDPTWQYQFVLPSDFIRAITVMSTAGMDIPYRIEENASGQWVLYANYQPVYLKYSQLVAEPQLPWYFIDALVARLKAEFAQPLIGDASVVSDAVREHKEVLTTAKNTDSLQSPPLNILNAATSPWVRSRLGGWGEIHGVLFDTSGSNA